MAKKIIPKKKNPGGRPRKHNDLEKFQTKINEYFNIVCKDEILTDGNGDAIIDSKGRPAIKSNPPTITGLARHLGFIDRQSIYDAIARNDGFSCAIKKAINQIEEYAEKQLFSGNGNVTGAIFWLKNRGDNWRDRHELDHTTKGNEIGLRAAELRKRILGG